MEDFTLIGHITPQIIFIPQPKPKVSHFEQSIAWLIDYKRTQRLLTYFMPVEFWSCGHEIDFEESRQKPLSPYFYITHSAAFSSPTLTHLFFPVTNIVAFQLNLQSWVNQYSPNLFNCFGRHHIIRQTTP